MCPYCQSYYTPGYCGNFLPFDPTQCQCTPCSSVCPPSYSGAVFQMDTVNVIYHKDNNATSQLINLGLSNGATLQLILESIDSQLGQLVRFGSFILPFLKNLYSVTSLQTFASAVDNQFAAVNTAIAALTPAPTPTGWLGNLSSDPGAAVNGNYWWRTSDNSLRMKVNGIVITISHT